LEGWAEFAAPDVADCDVDVGLVRWHGC
jgi:hypothetical protein